MKTVADLVNDLFAKYRKTDGSEFTNSEVARSIGGTMDASYLSKLRNGKITNPGRESLLELCKFFGVPPLYFFPELDLSPPESGDTVPIDIALRSTHLSPDIQNKLAALIQAMQKSGGATDNE